MYISALEGALYESVGDRFGIVKSRPERPRMQRVICVSDWGCAWDTCDSAVPARASYERMGVGSARHSIRSRPDSVSVRGVVYVSRRGDILFMTS